VGEKNFERRNFFRPMIILLISINQSIKVICNARNVVHKLKSEARAVTSGRVLMVIEKVGLWGLKVFFESI